MAKRQAQPFSLDYSGEIPYPYLRGMARHVASSPPSCIDRNDLTQEGAIAWIRAKKNYDPGRDEKGLGPDSWARTRARWEMLRVLTRGPVRERREVEVDSEGYGELVQKVSGPAEDLASSLQARRILEAIPHCLSLLSEDEATVLRECGIEMENQEAVAERMGKSVEGVKALLYRARRHLRKHLKDIGVMEAH